jgi:PAS domain S-box-containing protein
MSPARDPRSSRLLVVDDEENVLLTIAAILSQRGYQVETASSGQEAIDRIAKEPFDLVLTDLSMKEVDGIEVVGAVREHQPDTVAIMLTGYASLDSAIEAIRRGAYDYLTKPTNIEEMIQTVERGLEKRRMGVELKRRVEELATLHRLVNVGVDSVLRSTRDLGEALGRIAGILADLLAPGGAVAFLRGERLEPVARHAGSEAAARLLDAPGTATLAREAIRAMATVASRGAAHACLAAPIEMLGKTLGALVVCDPAPREWTDEQRQAAGTIASRAALAIENAALFAEVDQERDKLSLILGAVGDAVVGLDSDDRIVFFNRTAERLTGHAEADVRGRGIAELLTTAERVETLPQLRARAAATSSGITSGELVLRCASGQDMIGDAVLCELRGAQGGPVRAVLAVRDARDRRRLEEQKNNALSQFTHELKTPLTSVLAYAFLMTTEKLGPINERQLEAMRVVRRNGQHLLGIIENMLLVSQLSQGLLRYRRDPTSFAAIFAELRDTFQPIAAERHVDLSLETPPELEVVGDRETLTMAANNLLGNALRFTDQGGSVRVVARDLGAEVRLEVHDTGIGIAEEFHGRLFQRYFQPDPTRGGTGLGLHIVKSIVEAHGGRIWVESRLGAGAHFFVALPKAGAPAAGADPATSPEFPEPAAKA